MVCVVWFGDVMWFQSGFKPQIYKDPFLGVISIILPTIKTEQNHHGRSTEKCKYKNFFKIFRIYVTPFICA